MALGLRTEVTLPFNLHSYFWKFMTGDKPKRKDLDAIDSRQLPVLHEIENSTEKQFAKGFGVKNQKLKWVFVYNGKEVELIPNGKNTLVTYEKRKEYVAKVIKMQLEEVDLPQLNAIKTGFGQILPVDYLSMLKWKEFELAICGAIELDIAQLKETATYDNVSPEESHIQFFWRVLEELSSEEQAQFLRFAWARTRMPVSGTMTRGITIQGPPSGSYENPDVYHPTSSTSFFQISLPRYTTYEMGTSKFLVY